MIKLLESPDARLFPSGLNATVLMLAELPVLISPRGICECISHKMILPSPPPDDAAAATIKVEHPPLFYSCAPTVVSYHMTYHVINPLLVVDFST